MFLKQTYQYSKLLFALLLAATIVQVLVNYKHGAVVSPFYHYGMYSGAFKTNDHYDVTLIEINGRVARGQDFTMQQWDKIYLPITYYLAADSNNNSIIQLKNKFYNRLSLHSLGDKNAQFINPSMSPTAFINWYARYLTKVTGHTIQSLAIKKARFNSGVYPFSIDNSNAQPILPIWFSAKSIDTR